MEPTRQSSTALPSLRRAAHLARWTDETKWPVAEVIVPGVDMSKRSNSRRPVPKVSKGRDVTVWVDFGKDQVLSGISPPNERGELTFFGEDGEPVKPESIFVGTTYERAKGRKTVTRAQANPAQILLGVNDHLEHYDWVFAVDTNTRTLGSDRVSVAAVVLLREVEVTLRSWSAKAVPQASLEFRDAEVPPERLGWRHLIWLIGQSNLPGRIAVFVDSDLDRLGALNAREEALIGDFMLPVDVTLLYASSDVGAAELIGNKALRECDRYSQGILTRIGEGDTGVEELRMDMPHFCKAYRFWPPPE